jgi:hypothetical protein
MIGHHLYLNAFAYLSEYGQSDCGFSHPETSNYLYECCNVETLYFCLIFIDVVKFNIPTQLALLISCKLSFPILRLRMNVGTDIPTTLQFYLSNLKGCKADISGGTDL